MADLVRVEGLDELKRAMMQVPVELQGKVSLELLRKAAVPMRDEARHLAPQAGAPYGGRSRQVAPGRLRKNIFIGRARDSTAQNPLVVIRVRRKGKADDPKNAFYWLFQELGFTTRDGRHIPGKRFLTRAFESKKMEALALLKGATLEQVEKAARKVAAYTARFRASR